MMGTLSLPSLSPQFHDNSTTLGNQQDTEKHIHTGGRLRRLLIESLMSMELTESLPKPLSVAVVVLHTRNSRHKDTLVRAWACWDYSLWIQLKARPWYSSSKWMACFDPTGVSPDKTEHRGRPKEAAPSSQEPGDQDQAGDSGGQGNSEEKEVSNALECSVGHG